MTREKAVLSRGFFTDWIIALLKEQELPVETIGDTPISVPVGDNNVPEQPYGWQGQPNDDGSYFIPWTSVATGMGKPSGGSFGDSASEHVMSYTITYSGVGRDQTEFLADRLRKEFANAERETVDCDDFGEWKILQVQVTSIGPMSRIASSFPDYYVQTDGFDIWVSKERSS